MKKPSCRRSGTEKEQHERAVRIRKMTDAQLCEYLDSLEAGTRTTTPNKQEIIEQFLEDLTVRSDTGLRISDATIRKIKTMATEKGYSFPREELYL